MRTLKISVLCVAFYALPICADTVEQLDTWFRDGYAALYKDKAWERADEFAPYFTELIAYRTDDGLFEADVNGFLLDSLEVWRDEGWVGTDVAKLDTKLLNESTALFDIKWKDHNSDGSNEFECGWYFADKIGGEWLLSQYIVMACDN